ncbi:MAG: hypothetical protein ACKOFN_05485, partial [Vulcanococcus sp.]
MSPTPLSPPLSPLEQVELLETALPEHQGFVPGLARRGHPPPLRSPQRVLQRNRGKLCNMPCSPCHGDAGPPDGAPIR